MTTVVHLIGQLGFGGTERQLYLLLKHRQVAMPDVEHIVVALNPSEHGDYRGHLEAIGVQVVDAGRGAMRRIAVIQSLLRATRASVVHSWSPFVNGYAALAGALSLVPHRLGSFRSSLESEGFPKLPAAYRRLCVHGCQQVVVNSRAIAQELRDRGVDDRRIQFIRNCVEISTDSVLAQQRARERSRLRQLLGLEPGSLIIGMVANLRPRKNHGLAITALSKTLDRMPDTDAHLVVVGQTVASDPDYPAQLQSQIRELGLERRVHLLGFRENAREIIAAYDVLCLSSNSEGMPNAIVEAMAHGLPVVATDVGGVPELVDEERGILVAPRDPDAMAQAFARIVADDRLRKRLGRAALAHARLNHDTQKNAEHFARIYERAAAKAA